MLTIKDIQIYCSNHTTIAGTIFKTDYIKGAVLIAPATGIRRRFYKDFAIFLAEHGYGVLTYSNQGIGESLKGALQSCPSSLVSWGEIDQTAALEALKNEFPNLPLHLIGHSAGGQLIGLMKNCMELCSIFNYACSSGSIRNMKRPYQLKAYLFMNFFIPVNNYFWGYTNSPLLNMGEPLPKKVASQWSKWCNGSGYVKMEFNQEVQQHFYDQLHIPSLWVNASDDDIAIDINVDDMTQVFTQLQIERLHLHPQKEGFEAIGHMKFFSKSHQELWNYALNWLDKNNQDALSNPRCSVSQDMVCQH
ncbi:MAG: alpha/beta hydrolase [Chitinophagales bacterium]|nr:alpha/beta hydrolase [Chitinophagales bacterium]MCZ2392786.1 alpha/beta hydrolase [Chitinophagales bacterium]